MAERVMLCESCYLKSAKFVVASSQKKYRDLPESWAALDTLSSARIGPSPSPSTSSTVQADFDLELPTSRLPSNLPEPGPSNFVPGNCGKPPIPAEPIAKMPVVVGMFRPSYFLGEDETDLDSEDLGAGENGEPGLHTPATKHPYKPYQLVYCQKDEKSMSAKCNSAAVVLDVCEIDLQEGLEEVNRGKVTKSSHWKVDLTLMQYDFDVRRHKLLQRQVQLRVESKQQIGALRVIPFEFISKIRIDDMLQSGKLFWELCRGVHYIEYEGESVEGLEYRPYSRFMVDMLGYLATHREEPLNAEVRVSMGDEGRPYIPGWREKLKTNLKALNWPDKIPVTEKVIGNAAYLVPTIVPAFCLSRKKTWTWIYASKIMRSVNYNTKALDWLALPKMLQDSITLVARTWKREDTTTEWRKYGVDEDDVKGPTMHFHGPEGSGKTITAMHLAEHIGVPYFRIGPESFGDGVVNRTIDETLKLGNVWRSVLILDQMDSLVQRRTRPSGDWAMIERVSHLLDHYTGLKILVTRADPAELINPIMVKAHHRFAFPDLPFAARRLMWERALAPVAPKGQPSKLQEAVDNLADRKLNGMEIGETIENVKYKGDWDKLVGELGYAVEALILNKKILI